MRHKRFLQWASCFVVMFMTLGCQSIVPAPGQSEDGSVVSVELGQPCKIKLGQPAVLEEEELEITFAELLEESRCPSNVQCVEAGQARILIDVRHGSSPTTTFELNTNPPLEMDAANFQGFQIRLVKLNPYPADIEQQAAAEEYSATLVVTELP